MIDVKTKIIYLSLLKTIYILKNKLYIVSIGRLRFCLVFIKNFIVLHENMLTFRIRAAHDEQDGSHFSRGVDEHDEGEHADEQHEAAAVAGAVSSPSASPLLPNAEVTP